jgi:hypothetical protein
MDQRFGFDFGLLSSLSIGLWSSLSRGLETEATSCAETRVYRVVVSIRL